MNITKLNKSEVDNILKAKHTFLDIDSTKLYDDRFTIAVKEQLFFPLNNGIVDEDYVIDIFNKVSDEQKRRAFINHLFYIDDENFIKYPKINKVLSEYIDKNSATFNYEYTLILKSKLLKDPKITESIYNHIASNNFDSVRHNSELLTEICFTYDLDKLVRLITKLTENVELNLIPYSNKHPFSILFNRTFNTKEEKKIIDLSFNYLLHRKVNYDWFYVFDLVNNYKSNELFPKLIKEKSTNLDNEMTELLKERMEYEYVDADSKRKLITKNTILHKINYYEIFKQKTLKEFNQKLAENLNEEILFGDGEIGRDPNYSEIIIEYFLPISGSDLSNFKFLSKLTYTDEEKRNAEITVYAINNNYGFLFKPEFQYDWVQINELVKFLNHILQFEGVKRKFSYTDDGRITYKSISK